MIGLRPGRFRVNDQDVWWNATDYSSPADATESGGDLWFKVTQKKRGLPELRVYDNEAWQISPEPALTAGGSLAGASAEVEVQNQLDINRRGRSLGSVLLRVHGESFDFTFHFQDPREMTQVGLDTFNMIADYINKRSKELKPATEAAVGVEPKSPSAADEIAKYASLRDQGILSEDEFIAKKKQLLGL